MNDDADGRQQKIRYHLSPNQSTALRQISHAPWTASRAQTKLQTTLGALYKRRFVEVVKRGSNGRYIQITQAGKDALSAQTHADIERSRTTYTSPFAAIIRELAGYDPSTAKQNNVVPLRKSRAA